MFMKLKFDFHDKKTGTSQGLQRSIYNQNNKQQLSPTKYFKYLLFLLILRASAWDSSWNRHVYIFFNLKRKNFSCPVKPIRRQIFLEKMVGQENSLDNSLIVEDLSFKFKILVSISGELSKAATSMFFVDSSATIRLLRPRV